MSKMLSRRARKWSYLCCGTVVLALAVPAQADPKPLTKEEQAKVDTAIDKGVRFLKRAQQGTGAWPPDMRSYPLGHTLLPAYALLEAGVPANDRAIQRAADHIRPRILKTWRTYEISLGLLFLDRLAEPKDEPLIRSLALRLIAGQHVTGGWNYRCPELSRGQENSLYKALAELDKALEVNQKSKTDIGKALELPRTLRLLAVFRDPRKLPWKDPPGTSESQFRTLYVGTTDNSNTQFAMLGLWAAQRHSLPVGPTFRLMVERFERSQEINGWWVYSYDGKGNLHFVRQHPSMLCVGLMGLAIGRGSKLLTPGPSQTAEMDLRILKGLAALSQDIGVASGGLEDRFVLRGAYYLWSVERVAMLYNLSMIGDKNWYRWGAGILVAAQQLNGEWTCVLVNGKDAAPPNRKPVIDTSFALLFLKHSHPLKELTGKLPYKEKELNQGIARLLSGAAPLKPLATPPSSGEKPDR